MTNKFKLIGLIIVLLIIIFMVSFFFYNNKEANLMVDLRNYNLREMKDYAHKNKLKLVIQKEYNEVIGKDKIIKQGIKPQETIKENDELIVLISLGPLPKKEYEKNNINELGYIPIMMYHGIADLKNDETGYLGGNVDKAGYTRTKEAFINDLEMYYQEGYRMIRLKDYINGNINAEFGKSPIVLTFDDGNKNNFNVLGLDGKGNLMIDPNSAVGILEDYKKKYPDFNVTATFFLNSGLFGQPNYNDKILKWLVANGYDIGNHTKNHIDFAKVSTETAQMNIAYMYQRFDEIIPNQYLRIISLPFGSPYKKEHKIFPYILNGEYNGYKYKTAATLRVGWDANYSPYHQKFDKTFIKRIRAWDNSGKDFDIEMCFKLLSENRYISDGDKDTIVINDDTNLNDNITDKKIIKY